MGDQEDEMALRCCWSGYRKMRMCIATFSIA